MTRRHFSGKEYVDVDHDGIPAAIVAVHNGEPLVLLVSEDVYNAFEATKGKLKLTHIDLANKLRESICGASGQFHENSIAHALRTFTLNIEKREPREMENLLE